MCVASHFPSVWRHRSGNAMVRHIEIGTNNSLKVSSSAVQLPVRKGTPVALFLKRYGQYLSHTFSEPSELSQFLL